MGGVMDMCAAAVRGAIIAPRGKKLVISDLSNIEGRGLTWAADEQWKLQAFRDFDAGIGWDLYVLAYARAFNIDPATVDKAMRQIGKVLELALGYQGGVAAFCTMAVTYGLDLLKLADAAYGTIPAATLDEARDFLQWLYSKCEKRHVARVRKGVDQDQSRAKLESEKEEARLGLPEKVFIVCDSLKRLWRGAHVSIAHKETGFWKLLETAAKSAILEGGVHAVGKHMQFDKYQAWLRLRLPSGRYLCYPGAKLNDAGEISYMGVNQYSRKWQRLKTYGGKLSENATQALSRDVMAHNMPAIEAAGYEIVLTVHDEIVTEAPDSPEFNAPHLSSLLATNPPWAPDLPLAAGGFETYRYRKQ